MDTFTYYILPLLFALLSSAILFGLSYFIFFVVDFIQKNRRTRFLGRYPELVDLIKKWDNLCESHANYHNKKITPLMSLEDSLRKKLPESAAAEHSLYSKEIDVLIHKINELRLENDSINDYRSVGRQIADKVKLMPEKDRKFFVKYYFDVPQ